MGKLVVFNFATLNGYFEGPNHDIGWHRHGAEESAFSLEGLKTESILLFGRVTYHMMVSWWPTPAALNSMPEVAKGMNDAEKIVFSRTLKKAEWNNTRILTGNIGEEVRKLKTTSGKDLTILGSGSIAAQLAELGLIDEYQIMIDPVVLGQGTTMFKGIKQKLDLKLTGTRTFKSGVVLLSYQPLEK